MRLTLFLFALAVAIAFVGFFQMLPWWVNFAVYFVAFALMLYCAREVPLEWKKFAKSSTIIGGFLYWVFFLPMTIHQYEQQHEIDLTFKTSVSPYREFIIRHDLSEFKDYFQALKLIVPKEGPIIGIGRGGCSSFANPQTNTAVLSREIWIGEECLSREEVTLNYSAYVIQNLPQTKRIRKFNIPFILAQDAFYTYFNWSFWNKEISPFCPGGNGAAPNAPTLWKIRTRLGRDFTDDVVAYAARLMMDDPIDGLLNADAGVYIARKLKKSESVKDDGANWPIILGILKEDGVNIENI